MEDLHLDQFVDEQTAARRLGCSRRFLQDLRMRGGGPKFYKPSARLCRYKVRELDEWMEKSGYMSTSEVATA